MEDPLDYTKMTIFAFGPVLWFFAIWQWLDDNKKMRPKKA